MKISLLLSLLAIFGFWGEKKPKSAPDVSDGDVKAAEQAIREVAAKAAVEALQTAADKAAREKAEAALAASNDAKTEALLKAKLARATNRINVWELSK